ncbi:MAG: asparagine synthetase B, partial [Alphaproteobacteria bacterium]|nr:asparagine synthetase B [Alphaproteobacteria bacterium]
IAGVVSLDRHADPSVLSGFHRSLRHRGPDDHGWLSWNVDGSSGVGRYPRQPAPSDVLLVQNRLSIIDLSPTGWQPMSTPDGRFHVVYNGEIYNYLELRAELCNSYEFVGSSDTEVLLAAWTEWGPASLNQFRGMFAFAMLDTVKRRLWLARDPFGIKPLFVTQRNGSLWFASEIPALIHAGVTSRTIDPQGLYDFLHS